MSKQTIDLTVAGKDLSFDMSMAAYNNFINGMLPGNKVQPAHNLCVQTVKAECKDDLLKMLKRPGAALQLSAALTTEYAPDLQVEVKKPSSDATD